MKPKKNGLQIEFVFPVAVFFFFTLCALIVILFSARVYQRTIADASMNYNANTSLAYLREKVHQQNAYNVVRMGTFGDGNALIMTESIKGNRYTTFIYAYQGTLRELFVDTKMAASADPAAGTEILPIKSFDIVKISPHLLQFNCTDDEGMKATALVEIL